VHGIVWRKLSNANPEFRIGAIGGHDSPAPWPKGAAPRPCPTERFGEVFIRPMSRNLSQLSSVSAPSCSPLVETQARKSCRVGTAHCFAGLTGVSRRLASGGRFRSYAFRTVQQPAKFPHKAENRFHDW